MSWKIEASDFCGSINHEGILNSKRMLFQERFHPIVGTLVGISESKGRNHRRKDQKCRPRF